MVNEAAAERCDDRSFRNTDALSFAIAFFFLFVFFVFLRLSKETSAAIARSWASR